jgi:hypothetical protein
MSMNEKSSLFVLYFILIMHTAHNNHDQNIRECMPLMCSNLQPECMRVCVIDLTALGYSFFPGMNSVLHFFWAHLYTCHYPLERKDIKNNKPCDALTLHCEVINMIIVSFIKRTHQKIQEISVETLNLSFDSDVVYFVLVDMILSSRTD